MTGVLKYWDGAAWQEVEISAPVGPQGPAGVVQSATPPSDTSLIWADTSVPDVASAPVDPTFVTLSTNGTLTNERVLTAGAGITLTDGGAGSTVTIAATRIVGSTTISTNTPSITFSGISTDWRDLTLIFSLRTNRAASAEDNVVMSINSNTNNHSRQGFIQYNGSVGNSVNGSSRFLATVAASTATTGFLGECIVRFFNAHTTDVRKSWQVTYVQSGFSPWNSGMFTAYLAESSAITSITIAPQYGSNFTAGWAILTGVR